MPWLVAAQRFASSTAADVLGGEIPVPGAEPQALADYVRGDALKTATP